MSSEGKPKFSLAGLLVVASALFLLALVLVPAIFNVRMVADMTDVGARGRDIYITIVGLSTIREPLGLTNVWPKTRIDGIQNGEGVDGIQDFGLMTFQNSTDYFYELYLCEMQERERISNLGWSVSYSYQFDYSLFAGAGVPRGDEREKLKPENNIWSIAADVRDEVEDIIPVLVTRNIDCGFFYKRAAERDRRKETTIPWSQQYKKPFSNKAFVLVQKGGGIYKATGKYMNRYDVNMSSNWDASPPVRLPPYLTPDSLVTPP